MDTVAATEAAVHVRGPGLRVQADVPAGDPAAHKVPVVWEVLLDGPLRLVCAVQGRVRAHAEHA